MSIPIIHRLKIPVLHPQSLPISPTSFPLYSLVNEMLILEIVRGPLYISAVLVFDHIERLRGILLIAPGAMDGILYNKAQGRDCENHDGYLMRL